MPAKKQTQQPKKWWQWLLLYPTLIVSLISAGGLVVPPMIELFKDKTKADKSLIKNEQAKLNAEMLDQQIECIEKVSPAVYQNKDIKANFVLRFCPNMYALVKIEAEKMSFLKTGYKWVDFSSFLKGRKTGYLDLIFGNALYAIPLATKRFKIRSDIKIICQFVKDEKYYQMQKIQDKCSLTITDVKTGLEKSKFKVGCEDTCKTLQKK